MNVELEDTAFEDLKRLGREVAERIRKKLEWLQQHPEPQRLLKRLKDIEPPSYSFRVGDWRVVGQIQGDTFIVRLIDHRSRIYERLRRG
jgi:mRNA interferase RelE/StbE